MGNAQENEYKCVFVSMKSRLIDPTVYSNGFCLFYFFTCRSDAAHFLRPHRMPLGSVDSEDGNALVDDELHTLLPGTREISTDDLSQVYFTFIVP